MVDLRLGFPDGFFNDEIRDEYHVSEKTKKIWAVEMDLLAELLRVCNKYDIKISVFAGTMLGAIRHKGFIPWDDDLDVCMTRDNFDRLLEVANKEFRYPYFLQTALSDQKYFCKYARLRNSETTGLISWQSSVDYNNGIYIDVFVLDGFIENRYKLKKQLLERDLITYMINSHHKDLDDKNHLKRLARTILQKGILQHIKYENLYNKYLSIMKRYEDKTERRTLLTHNRYFINRYWCNASDLENIITVPFEHIEVPISANYDVILKHTYGNYMEFPPVEKRGAWHDGMLVFDPDIPYKDFLNKVE